MSCDLYSSHPSLIQQIPHSLRRQSARTSLRGSLVMLPNIANLKESLNKIAKDVHGSDDEVDTNGHHDYPYIYERRNSHRFAHAKLVSHSSTENEIELPFQSEMEQYKAEIQRLQESEAGIKALSINYASLLKEKEGEISRLNEENGYLKHNLSQLKLTKNADRPEVSGEKLVNGQQKPSTLLKNCSDSDEIQSSAGMESKEMPSREKELSDLLEERNKSAAALQEIHDSQMRELMLELEKERKKSASLELKLKDNHGLYESLQEELKSLRGNMEVVAMESNEVQRELNEKISEVESLRAELTRKEEEMDSIGSLRRINAELVQEDVDQKDENRILTFPEKEHLELALHKLEMDSEDVRRQRDKALQELERLKSHLLEKESEESDKMDEDIKIIEELRAENEFHRSQMTHLERMLKEAVTSQEVAVTSKYDEAQKAKSIIDDLEKMLVTCKNAINDKNIELQNLQTALGQYYAELEARERLEKDLAFAKEELAKFSEHFKDAHQQLEMSKKEVEESMLKLAHAEGMVLEAKAREKKLEDDNAKLRHVLEQSMSRLNRMSMDSDFFVDRRIVIKLLVTYFQRNHSKEVLDLMVRMLGFSEEEKQRIGIAQHGTGKGVVRGVLSLPGRLVGGFRVGSSAEQENPSSESQSFADLWVDFLLKETEKERLEQMKEVKSESLPGVSKIQTQ